MLTVRPLRVLSTASTPATFQFSSPSYFCCFSVALLFVAVSGGSTSHALLHVACLCHPFAAAAAAVVQMHSSRT
jgi:hypothetical protein